MSTRELPESFAATLTPGGRGAVAVIGIRGPLAEAALVKFFSPASKTTKGLLGSNEVSPQRVELGASLRSDPSHPKSDSPPLRRILYGTWRSAGEASDPREDVVLTRFETHWELGCHGGAIASAAILADLRAVGIETISWQEWLALTAKNRLQASAAVTLAAAQSPAAAIVLLRSAELTEAAVRELSSDLSDNSAGGSLRSTPGTLESESLAKPQAKIEALLETARWAKHLTTPWHIVLAGLPNAGKSSLLNALVGYERAIVFEQPGTTRDVVTAAAAYEGWRWELRDTAGLRTTEDPLEAAGIERTDAMLAASDVTVLVIDGTRPWSESEPLRLAHPGAIVVRNKADLWENEAPDVLTRSVGSSPNIKNTIQQKDAKDVKNSLRQDEQEGAELAEKRQERDSTEGNDEKTTSLTPALSQNESGDVGDVALGEREDASPLSVSAVTGTGLEELRAAIHRRLALPSWEKIGVAVWDAALAHDLRTLQRVIADDPAALPAALRELRTWIE